MAEESITAEALDALAARLDEVEVYLHLGEKRERAASARAPSRASGTMPSMRAQSWPSSRRRAMM